MQLKVFFSLVLFVFCITHCHAALSVPPTDNFQCSFARVERFNVQLMCEFHLRFVDCCSSKVFILIKLNAIRIQMKFIEKQLFIFVDSERAFDFVFQPR